MGFPVPGHVHVSRSYLSGVNADMLLIPFFLPEETGEALTSSKRKRGPVAVSSQPWLSSVLNSVASVRDRGTRGACVTAGGFRGGLSLGLHVCCSSAYLVWGE